MVKTEAREFLEFLLRKTQSGTAISTGTGRKIKSLRKSKSVGKIKNNML